MSDRVNRPIGIVDSGLGGLTVLKEALNQLPNESYVYVGDNGRAPYGPRPFEEIQYFMHQIVNFLISQYDIKMLVVACNTATVAALDYLKDQFSIPIIGVISAGSQVAASLTHNQRIAVIGTKGTIDSGIYPKAIRSYNPTTQVFSLACPEFVLWVEDGKYESTQTDCFVKSILQPLFDKKIDTLVLGCTHFPIIQSSIQRAVGSEVTLVDSGVEMLQSVNSALDKLNLASARTPLGDLRLYTTGDRRKFKVFASKWLKRTPLDVRQLTQEGAFLREIDYS